MEMLFIAASEGLDQDAFERQLFVIRKLSSHRLRNSDLSQALLFYICSLSTKLIIYKGMLASFQVMPFFPDLQAADYESHLAMVHSRFATNTFPSWDRAQPLRFMAHNGEINTVKGNSNWMFARQGMMQSPLFGDDLRKLFPIIEPHTSDSGCFDNALEMFYHSGRKLQEAVMMMVPEAWQNHQTMPESKRALYEYFSALQEPWDGPASISFTDGRYIGADAGPQRFASQSLLRDKGRSGAHGQRSRGARHRPRKRAYQGPSAAGPHVSCGLRAGSHHRRRRAQGRRCVATAVRTVGVRTANPP
ncbi:MAG UNVERIFIED_CONTAM: hypothetical protein LVR18_12325 [Planctomycetaceae bacterium]|jgi:glutamate synthase (NADPH/NADH) large chain